MGRLLARPGPRCAPVVRYVPMDAQFLEDQESPRVLPLSLTRRLVLALDLDAPEGAAETLAELKSVLREFTERSLSRSGCRTLFHEHGELIARYFRLISTLVEKLGPVEPSVLLEEWDLASEHPEEDGAVRTAFRRAIGRMAEADAAFGGPHGAELQRALVAEQAAFGTPSPLQQFMGARAELMVAVLAVPVVPSGSEVACVQLLDEIGVAHDEARARSLERLFARLGRWKSPPLAVSHERTLWHLFGVGGVQFLLGHLGTEHDADRLDAAAEVLIARWPDSAGPLRTTLDAALRHDDKGELLSTLLRALRWVRPDALGSRMDRALLIGSLREVLAHRDPDVREAAARAFVVCRGAEAADVLRRRLPYEPDDDVREVLLALVAASAAHASAA